MKPLISLILALIATQTSGQVRENPYAPVFRKVVYRNLGLEVEKRHPNARILILDYCAPYSPTEQAEAFLSGLKTAQAGKTLKIAYPKAVDKPLETPDLAEFTAATLNDLLHNTECNVVVCFVWLPPGYGKMSYWSEKKAKGLPPLVLTRTDPYGLREAIRESCVSVVLHAKRKTLGEFLHAPTEAEVFNRCYILITPDNVDEAHARFPNWFPGPAPKATGMSLDVTHGANTPFDLPEPSEPVKRSDWIWVAVAVNALAVFVFVVWNRKRKAQ